MKPTQRSTDAQLIIAFSVLIFLSITASTLLIVEEYQFYVIEDFSHATPIALTA
jgi:hypothetical protein